MNNEQKPPKTIHLDNINHVTAISTISQFIEQMDKLGCCVVVICGLCGTNKSISGGNIRKFTSDNYPLLRDALDEVIDEAVAFKKNREKTKLN